MGFTYEAQPRAMTDLEIARSALTRRTRFGEFLGAVSGQSFFESLPGQAIAQARTPTAALSPLEEMEVPFGDDGDTVRGLFQAPRMSRQEWQDSPHFRPDLAWDEGMSEERAAALAAENDRLRLRQILIANRDASLGDQVAAFGAALVGAAPDPLNFVPIAGPAARAAAVSRFGRIGGRAALSAGEEGVVTTAAQPVLIPSREMFGDQVTLQDAIIDIALSAAVGSIFGGAAGVLDRSPATRALDLQTRADALRTAALAADQLARDAPIDVGAPSSRFRAGVERAEARANTLTRLRPPERTGFEAGPQTAGSAPLTVLRPLPRNARTRLPEPQQRAIRTEAPETPDAVGAVTDPGRPLTRLRRDNTAVGRTPEDDVVAVVEDPEADAELVDASLDLEVRRIDEAGAIRAEERAELEAAQREEQRAANANAAYDAAVICIVRAA